MNSSTSFTAESYISQIAHSIGANEQALRLLISLLFAYPLLYIHQQFFRKYHPTLQHLYFIICGLSLAIWNYGNGFCHSVVCILVTWLNLYFIGGTQLSVMISFIFQMGYLIAGYYITGTDTYDIKWTMPHCVLTLRLIALTYDVFDGQKKVSDLSNDQKLTALKKRPRLIDIASQTYFPASFLVGPQFSMKRYQDFIHGTLYPNNVQSPVCAGLLRGLMGMFLLVVYQIGYMFLPTHYLISESFQSHSFVVKCFYLGLWGKIILYKYMSCWLITEGACIMSGLAYSGEDENGISVWKGCANVKLTLFETGVKFKQLMMGFNTNTNNWVAQYVYKRLKFLNNRLISQFASLMFLGIWHGLHSGYYACFMWEFILMYFENNLTREVNKYPKIVAAMEKKPVCYIVYIVMKIYVMVFMGYSVAPFALLKVKYYWKFYSSVYFIGHILFGGWILYAPLLKKGLKYINASLSKEGESDKKDN